MAGLDLLGQKEITHNAFSANSMMGIIGCYGII